MTQQSGQKNETVGLFLHTNLLQIVLIQEYYIRAQFGEKNSYEDYSVVPVLLCLPLSEGHGRLPGVSEKQQQQLV